MGILNLLIKPYSSGCNINCRYCFYNDVSKNREVRNYGVMKDEVLEEMIKKTFKYAKKRVSFVFQGGEPTLSGVEYFEKFHRYIEEYNTQNIMLTFAIQTNGTMINREWVNLFRKYNYLVGISLDGYEEIHDSFRIDFKGKGTYRKVLEGIEKLKENNISFNILCVVNKLVAQNGKKIYEYFKNSGFRYIQFIPCIDKLYCNDNREYTLTASDYGAFLNEIFELWYKDAVNESFTSVRYFDNLLNIILGREPEACDMSGFCTVNGVIESNGDVYPCDFYVLDEYRLGNIMEEGFDVLMSNKRAVNFYKSSLLKSEKCRKCKYLKLCRSGCRRFKNFTDKERLYENKFCDSYLFFFDSNIEKMIQLGGILNKKYKLTSKI